MEKDTSYFIESKEKGEDSYGNRYSSLKEMWNIELHSTGKISLKTKDKKKIVGTHKNWYKGNNKYWNNVSRDNSGMLQGYEIVSKPDIEFSAKFLENYIKEGKIKPEKAIDCGGGIGRITKELLVNYFNTVDLVDHAPNLIETAKETIKSPHMRNFYVSGLQDFVFPDKYNCIWIQWVLMHMPDDDVIKLLKKCKESIAPEVF